MFFAYNDYAFHQIVLVLLGFLAFSVVPNTRPAQVVDVPRAMWSIPLAIFVIWILASNTVVLGSWSDRGAYGGAVVFYQQNGFQWLQTASSGEWLFQVYTYLVSLFTDYIGWFYVTALIYVGNYLVAARRLTKEYVYVLFFSIICNFQFYSYGENTIRAGFAASFVILGLSLCNKIWALLLCFFIAFYCHHSMAIPMAALLVAYKIQKPRLFLWGWLATIALSFAAGSTFEHYLMGFVDDRRSNYLGVDASQTLYKVGFRWDFLAYSAIPVLLGYYYIFMLDFKSQFYQWVYCAYLIANSFWVLVIRANYTDRFAYLSWFMFPILLLYPLLTKQLFRDVNVQRNHIVLTIVLQYAFCYYMYWKDHGFTFF